jgi:hypothetical protein
LLQHDTIDHLRRSWLLTDCAGHGPVRGGAAKFVPETFATRRIRRFVGWGYPAWFRFVAAPGRLAAGHAADASWVPASWWSSGRRRLTHIVNQDPLSESVSAPCTWRWRAWWPGRTRPATPQRHGDLRESDRHRAAVPRAAAPGWLTMAWRPSPAARRSGAGWATRSTVAQALGTPSRQVRCRPVDEVVRRHGRPHPPGRDRRRRSSCRATTTLTTHVHFLDSSWPG